MYIRSPVLSARPSSDRIERNLRAVVTDNSNEGMGVGVAKNRGDDSGSAWHCLAFELPLSQPCSLFPAHTAPIFKH